ncbi:hypothetical protein VTK26DRAFT_5841 [Humicola hyalothermophila]
MASSTQVSPDVLVTFKVSLNGTPCRFKLPLRDVGINVLETKLRDALGISADADVLFERYSDSAASYVVLDRANTAVYKQLYRAAKAKQKLKLRVTVKQPEAEEKTAPQPASVEDAAENDACVKNVEPTDAEQEPVRETVQESVQEAPVPTSTPTSPEELQISQSALETTTAGVDDTKVESTKRVPEKSPAVVAPAVQPTVPETGLSPAPACFTACQAIRGNYAVCCNSCDRTIPDAHYHCSICDDGDFDLCQDCVNRGISCKADHWLIKRFVQAGVIINSTTERLAPKPKPKPKQQATTPPVAAERIIPVFNDFLYSSVRTCNCCVQELPEVEFVHCTTCDDYDLCRGCFAKNRHGHHPKHGFVPAVEGTRLEPDIVRRLMPGRGQSHNAICDGCDKGIKGIRHKCLDCPDWDYCSGCVVNSSFIHPGHRFVPIYEPLEYDGGARFRTASKPVHYGICCDGPLCSGSRPTSAYITGDRYKCAVCDDTDFCESCEASPANTHNRTHPLIKFKTPVRHVSVTTTGEHVNGQRMPTMGDRPREPPVVTSTGPAEASRSPVLFSNVQTVVDIKSEEPVVPVKAEEEKTEEKKQEIAQVPLGDLQATYIRDTVLDGTVLAPDHLFEQTWVLRNTGEVPWPAGCSVKFVGGDYMGHLDASHPAATRDVEQSCESNIAYRPVQPGEEFPFTVLLRTPHRSGRVISNWRLTTKDGYRFGHRIWCDVVVEKPKEVEKPKVVLPPPAAAAPAEKKAEEEQKKEDIKTEPEVAPLEHSQMIFPKLDKESPVASVHEETKSELTSSQETEYEDAEWHDDEDDGFLTDEEYDVLDASDEEFLVDSRAKQK